jgi:hypothetical protein
MKFLFFVLTITTGLSSAYALTSEQEILRLQKGEYYFHYLTQNFPAAMSQVSLLDGQEARGKEVDVMEAAMLLSLGLHKKAQTIFEKVQSEGGGASTQAWFYLARRWFELDEFYNTVYCLQQVVFEKIQQDYQLESQFMTASSYIALGEYNRAQKLIAKMPRSSIWAGYAKHNYIIKMIDGNSSGRSLNLLVEDATFHLPKTKEAKDLRDRINLIAGIHYLDLGKSRSANKYLKSVSLEGPYTPAALLQYGWAKVEQGKYEQALQPWRELQTRFNNFEPDVMESMLGVPRLFELMGAYTQAIKSYESIEERLLAMTEFVNATQQKLNSASWLDSWLAIQTDSRWGWQVPLDSTVPFDDVSGLLQLLFAEDIIVKDMGEYRDLVILSQYLNEKEEDLLLWQKMVKQRRFDALNRDVKPLFDQAKKILAKAKRDYDELSVYVDSSAQKLFSFPTATQHTSLQKLTRSTLNLETLLTLNSKTRDVELYQQRWARVRGVLLWQMNEKKPSMQWQLERNLINTKQLMTQVNRQLLETQLADNWSDESWQGLDVRVGNILQKTQALKALADRTTLESKNNILQKSESFIVLQKNRINDYLSQARLSIARLYDDALQRKIADGDIPAHQVGQ